jgi:hypothetical protein
MSLNRTWRRLLLVATLPYVGLQGAPLPKGARTLGIQVNEAQDRDYFKAFAAAKALGMEAVSLSANWDDIETSPRVFAPRPNYFAMANAFYPSAGVRLDLFVRALDTNGFHLPRDLRGRPIDEPLVIDRFVNCLAWVFSQLPDVKLTFLGIGNEIDVSLRSDISGYRRYAHFVDAVRTKLKTRRPGLDVGASATLDGLIDKEKGGLGEVNRHTSAVIVTYYPLDSGAGVKDPSTVPRDFHRLTEAYPGRPIVFSEAGYPSSSELKSSERRQGEFVREVFRAWDEHASQVRQITFYHLTDSGPETVAQFTRYYGLSAGPFKAFLASLGLRTFAGSGGDKEAFGILREEAHARGW